MRQATNCPSALMVMVTYSINLRNGLELWIRNFIRTFKKVCISKKRKNDNIQKLIGEKLAIQKNIKRMLESDVNKKVEESRLEKIEEEIVAVCADSYAMKIK